MAAVTGPGYGYPPTPVRDGRRRRWVWAAVGAWTVVLLAGVFWSVRNDPPTVPEQHDLGQALSGLHAASGAVVAAAQQERWVLRLGELRVEDCAITPVRDGQEATRDVTLYVPEGDARAALDTVADGLPEAYQAGVVATRGATRLSLFADAGGHVGVEAEAHSADQVLALRVFTGCRPTVKDLDRADPAAGAVPELLGATVAGVGAAGGSGAGTPQHMAVACPGGGVLATFEADAGPAEPDNGPRGVPDGTNPVWVEAGGWAYRTGSESVVVTSVGDRWRVSVTTGCRTP